MADIIWPTRNFHCLTLYRKSFPTPGLEDFLEAQAEEHWNSTGRKLAHTRVPAKGFGIISFNPQPVYEPRSSPVKGN